MSSALENRLRETRRKALKPSPKLNLVEWADTYRFLSPESSSKPGRFVTSEVAAARGPMLAVTDPRVKKISIMACTQLLKTEFINNIVGYFVHQDPSPIIVMQPTSNLAKTWSKDRLSPMIRDTPVLKELIKTKKSRDSGNTIFHKSFPGGHITVIGSNSPSELASRPVRITLRDEIDKYEDNVEGDPSALIAERSATFWNSLDVGVCSPTIKGDSRIEKEYLESDQRKFHVDCPHCGHNQYLSFSNVKWTQPDGSDAAYICPECTVAWSEKERLKAVHLAQFKPDGGYVAYAPFNGHAGFQANKLASPWRPLSELAHKFIQAQGDIAKERTFVNTQLAETFEEAGESPEHMRLYERRELYEINTCPKGVLFLTAGCDVQKDRIEVEIVGWGRGKESWSIDYRVLMGETSTPTPWKELDKILNETWTLHGGAETQIKVLAIDSGYNTQHVYNWTRAYPKNRVMAVKGSDTASTILSFPKDADVSRSGKKTKDSVKVWSVGVSQLKTELYGFLALDGAKDDGIYPPGFCHFPQYAEEHFKRLTAEELRKKKINGNTIYYWHKTYERNEQLDCRNYARAAANSYGLDRFKEQHWLQLEEMSAAVAVIDVQPVEQPKKKTFTQKSRDTKTNPFLAPGQKSFWSRR